MKATSLSYDRDGLLIALTDPARKGSLQRIDALVAPGARTPPPHLTPTDGASHRRDRQFWRAYTRWDVEVMARGVGGEQHVTSRGRRGRPGGV